MQCVRLFTILLAIFLSISNVYGLINSSHRNNSIVPHNNFVYETLQSRLQGAESYVDIPNVFSAGVQTVKQVPYVEMLKLVETFIKLKGEVAGRIWALVQDNSHIWSALTETLVGKLSTVHNLTLNAIVILRKIMEFSVGLIGQLQVGFGANSPYFNKLVNLG